MKVPSSSPADVTAAGSTTPSLSWVPERSGSFVAAATEALGGIDILVTNAGGPPGGNVAQTPVELNLMSVVAMCKAACSNCDGTGLTRSVTQRQLASVRARLTSTLARWVRYSTLALRSACGSASAAA